MSRLTPQIVEENNRDQELTLDELIPQYALNKTEMESYKKLCDRDNARIKEIMTEADETEHVAGDYVAKIIVSTRETMNEEMLITIIKDKCMAAACDFHILKTREYIDYDALEDAIYKGKIPEDGLLEIAKARETKEVVSLKVTRKKKKKGDE